MESKQMMYAEGAMEIAVEPLATAVGASLCWALGLGLLARPTGNTSGCSSFYGGAMVFVAGYALSVSSALSPNADTPTSAPYMAALSAVLPFCLLVQTWFEEKLPSCMEVANYLLTCVSAVTMQLSAPWPLQGPSYGLECLRRLEGFGQFPAAALAAYLLACLICLFAGIALVSHTVLDTGTLPSEKPLDRFIDPPRLALCFAVLCGAGSVATELALAIGMEAALNHSEAQYGTFALLLGFTLLLLVIRCSWECLQSLQVSLPKLAPLLFGSAAAFRVLQAQVLFRVISWQPRVQLFQGAIDLPSPVVCLGGALVLLSSMLFVSYHLIIDYDSAPYAVSPQVCSMIDRFR